MSPPGHSCTPEQFLSRNFFVSPALITQLQICVVTRISSQHPIYSQEIPNDVAPVWPSPALPT